MLCFASWRNPILKPYRPNADPGDADLCALLKFAPGTLRNWRHGSVEVDSSTTAHIFEAAIKEIEKNKDGTRRVQDIEKVQRYRAYYEDDEAVSLYPAIALLGMTVDDCQKIIDDAVYGTRPLFPNMYYDAPKGRPDADATRDIGAFKGLYDVWLERDGGWLHCLMRVRYLYTHHNLAVIRCKMNLPTLQDTGPDVPYWEYDGYLVVRREKKRLYWVFEQRDARWNDYVHMITDIGGPFREGTHDRGHAMAGHYLTTGQAQEPDPVMGRVLMERRPEKDSAVMELRMHDSTAELLKGDPEAERVSRCMEAYERLHPKSAALKG